MGAHGWVGFFTVTGDGEPERVSGSNVTAGFFRTLGITPQLGRLFTPEDDVEDAAPTVLLTHAFWQRRYGGRTSIVGEAIEVNAVVHDVIGILPEGYRHPEPHPEREPALYSLYQFERAGAHRDGRFIRAIGRLRPGSSVEAAEVELVGIAARLEEEYPESNTARGVNVAPLKNAIVQDARAGLVVLFGAVVAVLLIACANIANLQLAEGNARRHELGIKAGARCRARPTRAPARYRKLRPGAHRRRVRVSSRLWRTGFTRSPRDPARRGDEHRPSRLLLHVGSVFVDRRDIWFATGVDDLLGQSPKCHRG